MTIPDADVSLNEITRILIDAKKRSSLPYRIKVAGISMQPLLYENDYIEVNPYPLSTIKIGNIIVFEYGDNNLIIHRIIWKWKGAIYTKGDNAIAVEKICGDCILGRVVYVISNGHITRLGLRHQNLFIAGLSFLYKALSLVYRDYGKLRSSVFYKIYMSTLSLLYGHSHINTNDWT